MQRNTAIAVGLLAALCLALVLVLTHKERRPPEPVSRSAVPQAAASTAVSIPSAAPALSAIAALSADADTDASVAGFDVLPDGRKVPELPANAPKQVGFAVVVVTYQGAQAAPADARPKADAKRRADALINEAKQDFAAAVRKGDHGSTADAGHVPRDVLEPAVEYVLFTTAKGEVYPEPIDTPRGYWIVKRTD